MWCASAWEATVLHATSRLGGDPHGLAAAARLVIPPLATVWWKEGKRRTARWQ